LCYLVFNKLVYSVLTQHQYIAKNTWLHVSFLGKHLQANIYYMVAHLVLTYIMVTHRVYIKSYQFKILISSLNSSTEFLKTYVLLSERRYIDTKTITIVYTIE
jgi:hypothetical protein